MRPGGRIVIGDVAFGNRTQHDSVRAQYRKQWDDSEHYWIADEGLAAAAQGGIAGRWTDVSFCAGVFDFDAPSAQ